MIPPILVCFHWGWFFTSMIMGESVNRFVLLMKPSNPSISKPASWHRWSPAWASHRVCVLCPPQVHTLPWKKKGSSRCWLINTHSISYIFPYPKIHNYGQTWIWWHGQILVKPCYTLLFFGQKKIFKENPSGCSDGTVSSGGGSIVVSLLDIPATTSSTTLDQNSQPTAKQTDGLWKCLENVQTILTKTSHHGTLIKTSIFNRKSRTYLVMTAYRK